MVPDLAVMVFFLVLSYLPPIFTVIPGDPVVTAVTRSKLYVLAAPVTRVAYIGCLVTGRPAPTLVLTGTGISVPTSPTGSISTDLQITYSGAPVTYTCSAAGAASATVTLTRISK